MESSFPLQDGQINKLRILSEVYTQKKKKMSCKKKAGSESMAEHVLKGTKS